MSNKFEIRSWKYVISQGVAILLGSVFLLAALSKLGDLADFQKALTYYYYVPSWLQGAAVVFIPGLELAVGACLVTGNKQREAALIASLLLFVFLSLGIYSNLVGSGQSCGCLKIALPQWLELNGWWVVWRNLLLIAC